MVSLSLCNDFGLTYPQTHPIIEESSIEMGEETCYTNIQRFFTRLRKVIKSVFLTLVVALGQDSLPLAMTKASVFLSHIIKGYGDKALPVPTAVSSIPNEEELVVFI